MLAFRLPPFLRAALEDALLDPMSGRAAHGSINSLYLRLTALFILDHHLADGYQLPATARRLPMNTTPASDTSSNEAAASASLPTLDEMNMMRARIREGYSPTMEELAPYIEALCAGRPKKPVAASGAKRQSAKRTTERVSEAEIEALFSQA